MYWCHGTLLTKPQEHWRDTRLFSCSLVCPKPASRQEPGFPAIGGVVASDRLCHGMGCNGLGWDGDQAAPGLGFPNTHMGIGSRNRSLCRWSGSSLVSPPPSARQLQGQSAQRPRRGRSWPPPRGGTQAGDASACMCSSPSPGASVAPSTGIPGGLADCVSPCPPRPAKAGDIYRLERARWGPGRCLQQDHVSEQGSFGNLAPLALLPPWEEGQVSAPFLRAARAPLSPASLGTSRQ